MGCGDGSGGLGIDALDCSNAIGGDAKLFHDKEEATVVHGVEGIL